MTDDLRIFNVSRPRGKWHDSDIAVSKVTIVARTENQAVKLAVETHSSLLSDMSDGKVTKEELVVEDITDKLKVGYEIAAE